MNFVQYIKRRAFLRVGILITAIVSALIVIFSFLGQNTGTFVMQVDDEAYQRGLVLCEEQTFLIPTPRLFADPVPKARDITYSWLNIDAVKNTNGNYHDEYFTYVAYTFYAKNANEGAIDYGSESLNVNAVLRITSASQNIDEAIRVLIIEDDTYEYMYQRPDTKETEYIDMPEGIAFQSDNVVFNKNLGVFRPEQVKKFSVLVWLEGQDKDCTLDVIGGRFKMQLFFEIAGNPVE